MAERSKAPDSRVKVSFPRKLGSFLVESGTSISKAAKENGVPKSSLHNRVKGNIFVNSKICID